MIQINHARLASAIVLLLLCACNRPGGSSTPPPYSILDEVLAEQQYSNAIAQAERDLPTDEWELKPYRFNSSRAQREAEVAKTLLAEVRPRLKRMSVPALVKSMKADPGGSFGGVADPVYAGGNKMVIQEIKSRPRAELAVLPKLADDKVFVYGGGQGRGYSLAEVIYVEILGTTVPAAAEQQKGAPPR
jgi:hypothetical protein